MRILPLLEIDAEGDHCASCSHVAMTPAGAPVCMVFTGELDEDEDGVIRADECKDAQARAFNAEPCLDCGLSSPAMCGGAYCNRAAERDWSPSEIPTPLPRCGNCGLDHCQYCGGAS